jgi:hypothetical protein
MLNAIIVKMWIESEIKHLQHKLDMGTALPVSAKAQINVLKKFYDEFNLEAISLDDVQYHSEW